MLKKSRIRSSKVLLDVRYLLTETVVIFQAIIVSDAFSGKNMVQQHQLVYQTLGDKVGGEELHALSISTYTNEEWQQQKKFQGNK